MAQGCAAAGSLMVVSTNAGSTFDDIAATGVSWWLQVYLTQDRTHIEPVLDRAVSAGAKAVVLTLDTPVPGAKHDLDDADFGDLTSHWRVNHSAESVGAKASQPAGHEHARDISGADIGWLAERTGLPVVVKGVLRPDDARRCVSSGASAVWVSNHGGRQLDRSVATATALPGVVSALGASAEVYVDGGVRSGLDVLAAIALGARAAFLGRLPLYALADRGSAGVESLLNTVTSELADALVLAGCEGPNDTGGVLFSGPIGL